MWIKQIRPALLWFKAFLQGKTDALQIIYLVSAFKILAESCELLETRVCMAWGHRHQEKCGWFVYSLSGLLSSVLLFMSQQRVGFVVVAGVQGSFRLSMDVWIRCSQVPRVWFLVLQQYSDVVLVIVSQMIADRHQIHNGTAESHARSKGCGVSVALAACPVFTAIGPGECVIVVSRQFLSFVSQSHLHISLVSSCAVHMKRKHGSQLVRIRYQVNRLRSLRRHSSQAVRRVINHRPW